jgi:hypothetical protein
VEFFKLIGLLAGAFVLYAAINIYRRYLVNRFHMELLDKRSISALVLAGGFLIYNYLANTTLVISIILYSISILFFLIIFAFNIKSTNIPHGILSTLVQTVGSTAILFVIIYFLMQTQNRKRKKR